MTTQNVNDSNEPRDPVAAPTPASTTTHPPTLAEDLLLLLFLPKSGTIAGENTHFYALGGAVLSELALAGRVEATDADPRPRLSLRPSPTRPPRNRRDTG